MCTRVVCVHTKLKMGRGGGGQRAGAGAGEQGGGNGGGGTGRCERGNSSCGTLQFLRTVCATLPSGGHLWNYTSRQAVGSKAGFSLWPQAQTVPCQSSRDHCTKAETQAQRGKGSNTEKALWNILPTSSALHLVPSALLVDAGLSTIGFALFSSFLGGHPSLHWPSSLLPGLL